MDDDRGDGNRWGGFAGRKRSNETHRSKTDPEARLMRKSSGPLAVLCYSLHVLMENRSGPVMGILVADARTRSEVEEAVKLVERPPQRYGIRPRRMAADKSYDTGTFLQTLGKQGIQAAAMWICPAKAWTHGAGAHRTMNQQEGRRGGGMQPPEIEPSRSGSSEARRPLDRPDGGGNGVSGCFSGTSSPIPRLPAGSHRMRWRVREPRV